MFSFEGEGKRIGIMLTKTFTATTGPAFTHLLNIVPAALISARNFARYLYFCKTFRSFSYIFGFVHLNFREKSWCWLRGLSVRVPVWCETSNNGLVCDSRPQVVDSPCDSRRRVPNSIYGKLHLLTCRK